MLKKNLAAAKTHLSKMVSSALRGEDVVICKDGVPAVRLVPIRPVSGDDPCRVIPELVVEAGDEALAPLSPSDWGSLAE